MLPQLLAKRSARAECARAEAALHAQLDGAEANLPEAVRRHLDLCESCRRQARALHSAESALLSAHAALPSPGDMSAEFRARLTAAQPPRIAASTRVLVPALGAAVALAAVSLLSMHAPYTETRVKIASVPDRAQTQVADGRPIEPAPAARVQQHERAPRRAFEHPAARVRRRLLATAAAWPVRHRRIYTLLTHEPLAPMPIMVAATTAARGLRAQPIGRPDAPAAQTAPQHTADPVTGVTVASASGDVDFRIEDDERGFTSAARISTSEAGEPNVIRIDSNDAP